MSIDGEKTKFSNKRLKDLAREPVKFKHAKRNWQVKIGADEDKKQFMLNIDGVAYEDLLEWDDKGVYRSSMENNWKGKVKKTDYVVLADDEEVGIKIRHDEKTNLTKIQINDKETIIRGKTLIEIAENPLSISHDERDWNLEFGIDRHERRFSLKLNSRPFLDLPDESVQQAAAATEQVDSTLSGTVEYNDIQLLHGDMGWSE